MARTPRAKVSATAGQGVSRLSYQQGYRNKPVKGGPKATAAKPPKRGKAKAGKPAVPGNAAKLTDAYDAPPPRPDVTDKPRTIRIK